MDRTTVNFGSLFSGIGGFDLGFERAGMVCSWQCEIDAAAASVLSRHWPDVPKFADVREVTGLPSLNDRNGSGLHSSEFVTRYLADMHEAMAVGAENDSVCQCVNTANSTRDDVMSITRSFVPATSETGITMPATNGHHPGITGLVNTVNPDDIAPALVPGAANGTLESNCCPMCNLPIARNAALMASDEPAVFVGSAATPAKTNTHEKKYNVHSPKYLEPVDVICAGFPCQDLSVAGNRAGLAGGRSGLFFQIVRVVREMREATDGLFPGYVVLENVPGLVSSNSGRDFAMVIRELANIGALDIAWRVLDAQFFGVAQRRRRLFLVADFRAERAAEILFEPESVRGDSQTRRASRQDIAGTLGGSSQSGGFRTTDLDNSGAFIPLLSPALRAEGHDASEDGRGRRALIPTLARSLTTGEGSRQDGESYTFVPMTANPLATGNGHASLTDGIPNMVATFDERNVTSKANRTRVEYGLPANTLHSEALSVITPMAVRRLTPTECERLQGFPDGWTAGQADSSRYRQLGNAVAVPVAEWIARRIMEAGR